MKIRDLNKIILLRKPLLIELYQLAKEREKVNKRIRQINKELNSLDAVLVYK